jgi:hypothetical protein
MSHVPDSQHFVSQIILLIKELVDAKVILKNLSSDLGILVHRCPFEMIPFQLHVS